MILEKTDKIQEGGLCFVYNDWTSTYGSLLSKANRHLLFVDRLKKLAILVFKCKNEIGPVSLHDLYTTKNIPYGLRDQSKLVKPKVSTSKFGLNSLKYSGTTLWNEDLPVSYKEITDFNTFKNLIKTWTGPKCNCGICRLCRLSR